MTKRSRSSRHEYLPWLCSMISHEWMAKSYLILLEDLFSVTYKYSVPNDDNRYEDGYDLRAEYFGFIIDDSPVSVLEVLISIVRHMDDNVYDEEFGEHYDRWFWLLICNLKLDRFDDSRYNSGAVKEILEKWMNREYDYEGNGGLFPLQRAEKNQKYVEIWYQMQAYIQENYDF